MTLLDDRPRERSSLDLFEQTEEARGRVDLDAASKEIVISSVAARRLAEVLFGIAVAAVATYAIPGLAWLRPWKPSEHYVPFWNVVGREWFGEDRALVEEQEAIKRLSRAASAATQDPAPPPPRPPPPVVAGDIAAFPAYAKTANDEEAVEVFVENAEALEHYYRRLTLVELGAPGVVARATNWGDSLLGNDALPAGIRKRLQARFGDAGHGFHVLAPFNTFHRRQGIRFNVRLPWAKRCELLFACEADGRYGLGGVSARSSARSASQFATTTEGVGSRVSHFELWYAKEPSTGRIQVVVDGGAPLEIDTSSPEPSDEVMALELADGPHEFEVVAAGGGPVRGYGVVLERSGPGVVWDNLAVIGTYTLTLDHQDAAHIAGQIRRRNPDLVVFALGGNDVQRGLDDLRTNYEGEYRRSIRKYRAGAPQASCLVLGVTDHGKRAGTVEVTTVRSVPVIVDMQRTVALAEGCAFFDQVRAMGGPESIGKWLHSGLIGADLGHPTMWGHELLASLIYRALMRGYADFRGRVAGQPFPEWQAVQGERAR
jgi:hypothetical protein